MQLVLVDTCIFVDFFRVKSQLNAAFRKLVDDNLVVLSGLVKLELLLGARKEERQELSALLTSLKPYPVDTGLQLLSEQLMPTVRSRGLNAGLIDFLIIMQAMQGQFAVFSRDKTMNKLAMDLGVELYAPISGE